MSGEALSGVMWCFLFVSLLLWWAVLLFTPQRQLSTMTLVWLKLVFLYLFAGSVHFLPSANTISSGDYLATFPITLTKINKFGISNYEGYFGWRGVNIIILTQSQGTGVYSAGIKSQTAASIDVECFIYQLKFVFLTGNYILIHPDLISKRIIFGGNFYSNTACAATMPV